MGAITSTKIPTITMIGLVLSLAGYSIVAATLDLPVFHTALSPNTLAWWLPGAILTVLIILAVYGLDFDMEAAREVFGTKMYVTVYIEIVSVTRNSIGPMLAWTLINGQVWYIARLLMV